MADFFKAFFFLKKLKIQEDQENAFPIKFAFFERVLAFFFQAKSRSKKFNFLIQKSLLKNLVFTIFFSVKLFVQSHTK